jgi:hypothetical protein
MSTPPDTTTDWLAAVRRAGSEDELLEVMRRYVATRAALELARLPPACRPRPPESRDDILESAVVLAREDLKAAPVGSEALHQMAAVFAEASLRLTRMVERGGRTDPNAA